MIDRCRGGVLLMALAASAAAAGCGAAAGGQALPHDHQAHGHQASTPPKNSGHPQPAPSLGTVVAAPPKAPYRVGQVTVHLVDRSRPTVSEGRLLAPYRVLTTVVWVPQAPGRWPLVVFAHGYKVSPAPYTSLLRAWAAHGYVVAAPEFPLTDPDVAGAGLDENDLNNEPADLRFVTDSLVTAGPVASRIDPSRVAVSGHSDGGMAALAAAVAPRPRGGPAYRAEIAMSVQPLADHVAANPPILVTQGDADSINPPNLGYQTWQLAAGPKYLLVLHGGGHLPPLLAGSGWLPRIEAITEAFLDRYVAGDGPAAGIAAASKGSPLVTLRAG